MFGFVLPNLESLEEAQRQRYRSVYCGVCRSLKDRYGQACRLTVSYDMTFLALVLGSLYEPEETCGEARCPVHPMQPQSFVRSKYTDYAADLSVTLAYHKMLDDWHDDHTLRARGGAFALAGAYRRAKKRVPQECEAIETAMADIRTIEQRALQARSQGVPAIDSPLPDEAANRFGMMLGDLFAHEDDFWVSDLRRFGARLGKFVYVMDAAMDIEDDSRTGSYNPFADMESTKEALRENLEFLAAGMTDAFERLPLERDVQVMRSVLYAGVWQRFEAKESKTHDG
ncbi:MAG: DUF5685 family protein [Eggerthellaceae bacterium]